MIRFFKIILVGISMMLSHIGYAQEKGNTKVLFVVTSHSNLGNTGEKTGLWIEEFATPYYALKDKGIDVVIASPKGGQPPIDPKSELSDYETKSTKRFFSDPKAQKDFSKSVKLRTVKSKDYDAIFYPGGHGPMWDLVKDAKSIKLIEEFYNVNKPIAFVCHAPAVLKNVKNIKGESLVKGKKVSGFTNKEEDAVGLTQVVPFLVENMLKEKGGKFQYGENWSPYAVKDGMLITGQNPQSSELVIDYLLEIILKP